MSSQQYETCVGGLYGAIILTTREWFEKALQTKASILHFPPGKNPKGIRRLKKGSICLILIKKENVFAGELVVEDVKTNIDGKVFREKYASKSVETEEVPPPKDEETCHVIEFRNLIKYPREVPRRDLKDIKASEWDKPLADHVILGFTLLSPSYACGIIDAIRSRGYGKLLLFKEYLLKEDRKDLFNSFSNLLVLAFLISGKNILIVGPPASGKTSSIKDLLDKLGFNFGIETGNPDWTPFDTIGGVLTDGKFKQGFITKIIEECAESISNENNPKPKWLILDEINRMNIDFALSKFFTLMDLDYRDKPLISPPYSDKEYYVPYSFRILATMNSYDRAFLQKIGYALVRRFALLNYYSLKKLDRNEIYQNTDKDNFKKFIDNAMNQNISNISSIYLDFQRDKALKTLILPSDESNKRFKNDYGVIFEDIYDKLRDIVSGRKNIVSNEIDLEKILLYLINEINKKLESYHECEYCPVVITPGLVADMLRFATVSSVIYDLLPQDHLLKKDYMHFVQIILDFALASLALPQLDILADIVKMGEIGGSGAERLRDILNDVASLLESFGLKISSNFVKRIAVGYHIF